MGGGGVTEQEKAVRGAVGLLVLLQLFLDLPVGLLAHLIVLVGLAGAEAAHATGRAAATTQRARAPPRHRPNDESDDRTSAGSATVAHLQQRPPPPQQRYAAAAADLPTAPVARALYPPPRRTPATAAVDGGKNNAAVAWFAGAHRSGIIMSGSSSSSGGSGSVDRCWQAPVRCSNSLSAAGTSAAWRVPPASPHRSAAAAARLTTFASHATKSIHNVRPSWP